MEDVYVKIYVSVDMEGIAGIVFREQLTPGEPLYTEARHLLTHEVNVVVQSLIDVGVDEIIVKDAHHSGLIFCMQDLHRGAQYCFGGLKLADRFAGVDASFDGAFLVGYHGMGGIWKSGSVMEGFKRHWIRSCQRNHYEVEAGSEEIGNTSLKAIDAAPIAP